MSVRLSTRVIVAIVTMWILIVAGGIVGLAKYKSSPGDVLPTSKVWPAQSKLPRTPGITTLVMVNHPRCPCTRASIAELGELMSQVRDRPAAYVLFVRPMGFSDDWTKTDLWQSASRIPDVHVVIDEDGTEAAHFSGLTSGHVILYDGDGRLKFSGGITGASGHVGDNLGLRRVVALLSGREPDRTDSPVFGCPLHEPK